jgi:hypothetical protein
MRPELEPFFVRQNAPIQGVVQQVYFVLPPFQVQVKKIRLGKSVHVAESDPEGSKSVDDLLRKSRGSLQGHL